MTLPLQLFTLITLAFITLALVFYNRTKKSFGVYVALFLTLFVLGKFTIESYVFPPKRIFDNSRFHFLEHQGFQFAGNEAIVVAGGKGSATALYNDYEGRFTITGNENGFTLNTNGFEAPVYVAEKPGFAIKSLQFKLLNAPSGFDAAKGFGLRVNNETLLCKIEPGNQYVFTHTAGNAQPVTETSTFNEPVKYGLPVMSLLRQTGLQLSDELEEKCNAVLLLRETVYGNTKTDNESPLRIFARNTVQLLNANGQPLPREAQTTYKRNIGSTQLFYIGYMQRAVNSTDDPVWYLTAESGKRQLRLLMPTRFELPHGDSVLEKNQVLFISSSSDELAERNFGAGYLLPWFNDFKEHQLHTLAYFSYTPGNARDILRFNVVDMKSGAGKEVKTYTGNRPFALQTGDGRTEWLFRFANLHADSLLQTRNMELVLGGYILGVLFMIMWVRKHRQTVKRFTAAETRLNVSRLELVVYLVIIPFLILRLLVLWRIHVFQPVQGIDYLQLADYLNPAHFYQLIGYGLIPFFVLRLLILAAQQFRLYREHYKDGVAYREPLQHLRREMAVTGLLIIAGMIVSLVYTFLKLEMRYTLFLLGGYILSPLGMVFLVVRYKKYSLRKTDFSKLNPRVIKWTNGALWKLVLRSVLTMLVLFGAGAVCGFGLGKLAGMFGSLQRFINVFLPVCGFLYLYWRWLPGRHVYHEQFRRHFWLRVHAAAFTGGVLLLTDSGFSIIFIFFSSILFLTELFYFYLNLSIGHRKVAFAGMAVLLALLLGFSYIISFAYKMNGVREVVNGLLGENNNIKYRALVQTSQEDKLAAGLYFKEEAFTKLQNASANKWFINYYLNKDRNHYFQLQPHMDFGVSYTTQTMDLLVLRYIVAEHGEWLVFLLLALLLTISFTAGLGYRFADGVANANQYTAFAAALLVFVIGFMVWLAGTNRFIFFGQDFPLLSIQAKITTLLFFLFLLIVVANNRESKMRTGFELAGNALLHIFLLVTVLFFWLFTKTGKSEQYNMAYIVQQVQDKCTQLNTSFVDFQQQAAERDSLPNGFRKILEAYKQSEQWNRLHAQLEVEKDSLPFAYSVIDKLVLNPNTEKYNPTQLMHVVRNNYGVYEFAVNRHYFQVKPPAAEKTGWRGSLVSAFSQKTVAVWNGRTEWPVNDTGPSLNTMGKIAIARYPAGYLANDHQQLVLCRGDGTGGSLVLHAGKQAAYAAGRVYRIEPNEWIQMAAGNTRESYFVRETHTQALARSIWLNGDYRLFFPLKDQFIWPYNMGNAVAAAYGGTDKRDKDFVASIDFDLHAENAKQLEDFENSYRTSPADSIRNKGRKQVVTVAISDGSGSIWDIQELDFARRSQPVFNPNNSADHFRFMRQLYQQRNAAEERRVLGHQAFLNMYNPGSTMKPFVYAATISGNKLPWDSLVFINNGRERYTELEKPRGRETPKLRVKYYTGKELYHGFGHDISEPTMSAVRYLAKSTNVYHSLIVYLGSYPEKMLDRESLYRDVLATPNADPAHITNFPLLSFGGETYIFNPAKQPRNETGKKYFGHPQSALAIRLADNFGLATTTRNHAPDTALYNNLAQAEKTELKQNTSYRQYALPEKSVFKNDQRAVSNFGDRDGLTNPTVGAVIVEVSPVKMAEMGARLYTANRDLRIRLNAEDTATYYKPFQPGRNYQNLDDLLATYRKTVYSGMHASATEGTSVELVKGITDGFPGWNVYAKTGTADQENSLLRHKTLLIVLSRVNMHDGEPLTKEMLKNNKVISFYFSFFNHLGYNWNDYDRALIKQVVRNALNSAALKKYMR